MITPLNTYYYSKVNPSSAAGSSSQCASYGILIDSPCSRVPSTPRYQHRPVSKRQKKMPVPIDGSIHDTETGPPSAACGTRTQAAAPGTRFVRFQVAVDREAGSTGWVRPASASEAAWLGRAMRSFTGPTRSGRCGWALRPAGGRALGASPSRADGRRCGRAALQANSRAYRADAAAGRRARAR